MQITLFILLLIISFPLVSSQTHQDNNLYLECLNLDESKCEICYKKVMIEASQVIEMKSCRFTECFQKDSNCKNYKMSYLCEQQCLKKCCESQQNKFTSQNLNLCTINNLEKKVGNTSIEIALVILTALVIIGFILLLIIVYLQFRPKKFAQIKNIIESKPCDKQLVKKHNWINIPKIPNCKLFQKDFYTGELQNCCQCKKQNPNCISECNHVFHISCLRNLRQKEFAKCPECSYYISLYKEAKIYCEKCKQRQCNIRIDISKQSLQKVLNFQKVNCDKCIENDEALKAAGLAQGELNQSSEGQINNKFQLVQEKY